SPSRISLRTRATRAHPTTTVTGSTSRWATPSSTHRSHSSRTETIRSRSVDGADAVRQRYVKAFADRDLDLLVSCWHADVETTHIFRPALSWRGADFYRQIMEHHLDRRDYKIVSTAVEGNRFYVEGLVEHGDGKVMPYAMCFEVEEGKIRRARVYTEQVVQG